MDKLCYSDKNTASHNYVVVLTKNGDEPKYVGFCTYCGHVVPITEAV